MDSLAVNVLAMACLTDNQLGSRSAAVHDALRPVAQLQQRDGSFGNVHTTGLVTQALVAVDPETQHLRWRRQDALNFLRRSQHRDGHFGGLLATAQAAPLLAGRTLADLASHARLFCSTEDNASASARKNSLLQGKWPLSTEAVHRYESSIGFHPGGNRVLEHKVEAAP
ncbi:hypothetical protein HPB52_003541 [Rhipicephalus sanguineus]|uniref:Uncharacterized protein n=1 Tax=Rhipicephalus sanguineus TaxID=34632 RepID=A0A9D4QHC8_RHISA|nr:hypothetical protein HPB52_003541 [Rhipicephalus sanguineus]